MEDTTLRKTLGLLQHDSYNAQAWAELSLFLDRDGIAPHERSRVASLLGAARMAHEAHREFDAATQLASMQATLLEGSPGELEAVSDLARLADEDAADDRMARLAYHKVAALDPTAGWVREPLAKIEQRSTRLSELLGKLVDDIDRTHEPAARLALLIEAGELEFRASRSGDDEDEEAREKWATASRGHLLEALSLDARNRRAATLLELLFAGRGEWAELANVLQRHATAIDGKDERAQLLFRAAKIVHVKLQNLEGAAGLYRAVVDLSPGHDEATPALVDFYNEQENWEALVGLYESQLARQSLTDPGIALQVAMLNWKMRDRPDLAEPYFERLRQVEPAHPGMLSFFRGWCDEHGETVRFANILREAERGMHEGPERASVAAELARLAEKSTDAKKAIEHWRTTLRNDPKSVEARESLKRLYREHGEWAALSELLRAELDAAPDTVSDPAADATGDVQRRLGILKEMGELYRRQGKSETTLVTIFSQIVELAPDDREALLELARIDEALGRWREWLAVQAKLAAIETDPATKAERFRSIARRWLEQFSNAQQAAEAYEHVLAIEPSDAEAFSKLQELYQKRRAYPALATLLENFIESSGGTALQWLELAKLMGERLGRPADALKWYRRVLEAEPDRTSALDGFEKIAEREKDYASLIWACERRVVNATDDAARSLVYLKLGALYGDKLDDADQAARAYEQVLRLSPGQPKALRMLRDIACGSRDLEMLESLYGNDPAHVADGLAHAADACSDSAFKIEVLLHAAEWAGLAGPELAVRLYEKVLASSPAEARALTALVSAYEAAGKHQKLLPLYATLASTAPSVEEKVKWLENSAVVAARVGDAGAAYSASSQVYALAPEDAGAFDRFVASAMDARKEALAVGILSKRLQDASSTEERRQLLTTLTKLYADRLGDMDEAARLGKQLFESAQNDGAIVTFYDALLRRADRRDDLRALFAYRIEHAEPVASVALLNELAELESSVFDDSERARACYESILAIDPEELAARRSIVRLLREAGRYADAARWLESEAPGEGAAAKGARLLELAEVHTSSEKWNDAFVTLRSAIELLGPTSEAIKLAERLLPQAQVRPKAARLLVDAYSALGLFDKQVDVMEVLIATAASQKDRLALYLQLVDLHEHKRGHDSAAFEVLLQVVDEVTDDLALWDRLAVLAKRMGSTDRYIATLEKTLPPNGEVLLSPAVEIDLAERIGTLLEERLGNVEGACAYWRRILNRDPTHARAFAKLKNALLAKEAWPELGVLYERIVDGSVAVSIDLLVEAANFAEEFLRDEARAVRIFERVLALDPAHEVAFSRLETLYARERSFESLALLWEASIERDPSNERRVRLSTLYLDELADRPAALAHASVALQSDPLMEAASRVLERFTSNAPKGADEHSRNAALALETAYLARGDAAALAQILEWLVVNIHDDAETRLRKLADLYEDSLGNDDNALLAWRRLVLMLPADVHVRERFLDVARRVASFERAVETLREAEASVESPDAKSDLLLEIARIEEDSLGHVRQAIDALERVVSLSASVDATLTAARGLERIAQSTGEHERLARALEAQAGAVSEAERAPLLSRLGDLYRDVLRDPTKAIDAFQRLRAVDANNEHALLSLDVLYAETSQFELLSEILSIRESGENDPLLRHEILVRLGNLYANRLSKPEDAIVAYRLAFDDRPAGNEADALLSLYAARSEHAESAEVLERLLSVGTDDRVMRLAQLSELRAHALGAPTLALESLRELLSIAPQHPSRAILVKMLDDDGARREAAEMLRPLYAAESDARGLLSVIEVELAVLDSVRERLGRLEEASALAEHQLGALEDAYAYTLRGLYLAVDQPEVLVWLERATRIAARADKALSLADSVSVKIVDIINEDDRAAVARQLAALYEANGKLEDAIALFRVALDLRGDDRDALVALERLYAGAAGDAAGLIEILARRIELESDDRERFTLLTRHASLLEQKGDAPGAVQSLEAAIDLALDEGALGSLDRLYATAGAHARRVELRERQLEAATSNDAKADLHIEIAQLLATYLNDSARALDESATALDLNSTHAGARLFLESHLTVGDSRARAAELLETLYMTTSDWANAERVLALRLSSSEVDEQALLLRRLAKLQEEQREDYQGALTTLSQLLALDVADTETWAELERIARVAGVEDRLAPIFAHELDKIDDDDSVTAELASKIGQLYEASASFEPALKYFCRAYEFDRDPSAPAFAAVDRALAALERNEDRIAHYVEALDSVVDPAARQRNLHLLAELAELAEGRLNDRSRAIRFWRDALESDEGDETAVSALRRLFAETEAWGDLASLVRARAERAEDQTVEAKLRLELAGLLRDRLNDPSPAIDELGIVLELEPEPTSEVASLALVMLEAHLGVSGELDERVEDLLTARYRHGSRFRDVVRLLERRAGRTKDLLSRADLFREIAGLLEHELSSPREALAAYAAAFELDPDNGDLRGEMDRLAGEWEAWDELAVHYDRAIGRAEAFTKRELLSALARLHDDHRDDPRRALETWERLAELDPDELDPLVEVERLATLLSDWQALVRALERKVRALSDDLDRAATYRQIGETRRDMLDDGAHAIEAFERAHELDVADTLSIDALIHLYEARSDAGRLVTLYRRRVELASPEERDDCFGWLVAASQCYEGALGNRREAIDVLVEALAIRPADIRVADRLAGLYRGERMWPELHETLQLLGRVTGDDLARRRYQVDAALLLVRELDESAQAIGAIGAIQELLAAADDDALMRELFALPQRHPEVKLDVADTLVGLSRQHARHGDLVLALELRLSVDDDQVSRAATLREIARVYDELLAKPTEALATLIRVLAEVPDDESLFADAEAICRRMGEASWKTWANALDERAEGDHDVEASASLSARAARVHEIELHDASRARIALDRALDRAGDRDELLAALDRVVSVQGDNGKLLDVIERRLAAETDSQLLAELHERRAGLLLSVRKDVEGAVGHLTQALDLAPGHEASLSRLVSLSASDAGFEATFEVLERMFRDLGRLEELAALHEQRVARATADDDRHRLRLEAARVIESECGQPIRAQRMLEAAVAQVPTDVDAQDELERVAQRTGEMQPYSAALEKAWGQLKGDVRSEVGLKLARLLAGPLGDAAAAEAVLIESQGASPDNLEIVKDIEQLRRVPGRERALLEILRTRARLEDDSVTQKMLRREARALAGALGDPSLVEAILRESIEADPDDLWGLGELSQVLAVQGQWGELADVLARRAELEVDASVLHELKHQLGQVLGERLGDAARALALYEAIYQDDPSDARAFAYLRAAYAAAGEPARLASVLQRGVEEAVSVEDRVALRLELAHLLDAKLNQVDDAIAALEAVLGELPFHGDSIARLSELYERTEQYGALVGLLEKRLDGARAEGDVESQVALCLRLASLAEERVGDIDQARSFYERATDLQPGNLRALSALARLRELDGDVDGAIAALSELVKVRNDADVGPICVQLGRLLVSVERFGEAEEPLYRALALDPGLSDARHLLRETYERQGRWGDLVTRLFEDAEQIGRENPGVQVALTPPGRSAPPPPEPVTARVLLLKQAAELARERLDDRARAISLLVSAVELTPYDRPLLLELVALQTEEGQLEGATDTLKRLIDQMGGQRTRELAQYQHQRAGLLKQLGRPLEALDALEAAFKVDAGSMPVLRDLAILAFESQDWERAQRTFRALLLQKLDENSGISKAEVFFYLGEVAFVQDDRPRARQMFERALEVDPAFSRAQDRLGDLRAE